MDRAEHYKQFFHQLTGFTPNPFQLRVADALLGERSVVLRAPTGSGKTWAVVVPFLYALHTGNPIADRLLYALPLRSLATSLYKSTKCRVDDHEPTQPLFDRIRIQTGEQRDDALFEGRVTFTTIDQLLSSYLMQPVGLPSRCGNINAGALLGALVCFDEFHLLEPAKSMATAIEMLDTFAMEQPLSRFVLMTATLSNQTLDWLKKKLKAEFIDVPPHEVKELPNEIGKQRCYRWIDEPLSAHAVASEHGGKRSIVIANSVTRAQQFYEDLKSIIGPATKIRLLHSRFLPEDRKRHESDLAAWFGPKPTVEDVILVSTQVVEAGLDFSCDNLHTEVAPMSAIVQRAGRCARRRDEKGTVWCYPLEIKPNGKPAYGAYTEVSALVDETAVALREAVSVELKPFVFHDELELVNRVHTDWELAQLKPLTNLSSHRKAVRGAMDGDNREAVRQLVRDVSSINVVITNDPNALTFNGREWPEMLSVPPMSLFKLFDEELPATREWIAKSAREQEVFQGGAIEMKWEPLIRAGDVMKAGWLIAIHPNHATYDANVGLVIGRGASAAPVRYRQRPKIDRYSYHYEEYADHIRRVCAAGHARDDENCIASDRLAKALNVTETQLAEWLDTVYRLHDIGKLSEGWQHAVWEWQVQKSRPVPTPRPPLAHTDFDPQIDWGKKSIPRPPHAAEGAYAARPLLMEAFEDAPDPYFVVAAMTAIVRHHGAFTAGLSDYRLIRDAARFVGETLGRDSSRIELARSPEPEHLALFSESLLDATHDESAEALPLYFYLVRRLRIADQNSFGEK